MARSKSDISNSAIRIFLQKVGSFYDQIRGFESFKPSKKQAEDLLHFFDSKCCYCGCIISENKYSQDHLIPMNKEDLGLHAWGNIVPCCSDCNNEKQQKEWIEFLKNKCSNIEVFEKRKVRIEEFVKEKNYDPDLDLHKVAGNLYEDIGAIAQTLIDLRYKQAEELIKELNR